MSQNVVSVSACLVFYCDDFCMGDNDFFEVDELRNVCETRIETCEINVCTNDSSNGVLDAVENFKKQKKCRD